MALTEKQKQFVRDHYQRQSPAQLAKAVGAKPRHVRQLVRTLRRTRRRRQERVFAVLTAILPFFILGVLELGLRVANYGGNTSLFLSAGGDYTNYYICNPIVGRRYFFMQSTIPDPPNDVFFKQKPANGYRIFALGGSTTAGYPYGNNIMFPRILQKRLQDVFPDRTIEVVNTAMTAINSYTLLDFLDEIFAQKPDLLLIYAGHNEFYGALGAASNESLGRFRGFVKLYLRLERLKIFVLLRNGIGAMRKWLGSVLHGDSTKPTATLMERMVGEQTIPYKGALYRIGRKQFEGNFRDILKRARKAGVKVMVSELVSNFRDLPPFISVKSDSFPPANEVYRRAQAEERAGQYALAKSDYIRAKDFDALRFRATEEFNEIVHRVAAEFSVPVVPMKAYFERESPHGLVGENLILEHLHPNVEGYFLMADAFFDTMRKNGFISPHWDSTRIRPPEFYRKEWGVTDLDEAYADIRIRILKGGWPFQPKKAPNRALVDFHPANLVDSLAYKTVVDDRFNLERAHVRLAELYARRHRFLRAFKEYRALVDMTPVNVSPYLSAAEMLVKARMLPEAIPYLKKSLQLKETAYANKWLGQIYLDQGSKQRALPFLERAAQMTPNDPQLIYNLSGAYALTGRYELARKTLGRLEKLAPNFPGAADLKKQLTRIKLE